MPPNPISKYQTFQALITEFAIRIGINATNKEYNKAWDRLMVGVYRLGLFTGT